MSDHKFYKKKLISHIEKVGKQTKLKTFDDLFRQSKGAFPDIVYHIASNLNMHNSIERRFYGFREIDSVIPESNPINYDWRFDTKTIKQIVKFVREKKFNRVALFGTPTLFEPLAAKISEVILFDINNIIKSHYSNDSRIIITDINNHDFNSYEQFDCVLMDPPWYIDYFRLWLKQASLITRLNGLIVTTLFQGLLRPNAESELIEVKMMAKSIGSIEIMNDKVSYITPLFEREIFNYKNIPCYENWRMADLLNITKKKLLIDYEVKPIKDSWARIELGTQTIALKVNKNESGLIKVFFPFVNEDSLIKTVSNRDSVRKRINFITSRNRGLIIKRADKVLQILTALSAGTDKQTAIEKLKLKKTEVNEIQKILDTIFA